MAKIGARGGEPRVPLESAPFAPGSDPVIVAFQEQAEKVIVGARAIILRSIEENTSVVLDGVHLVPGFLKPEEFEDAHVVQLVVAASDEESHRNRFSIRESQSSSRKAQKYYRYFDAIRRIQDYVLEQARKEDCPIIENINLDETVMSLLQVLSEQLAGRLRREHPDIPLQCPGPKVQGGEA